MGAELRAIDGGRKTPLPRICWRCRKRPMVWKAGPPLCSECAVDVGLCLECAQPKYDPPRCTCGLGGDAA